MSNKQLDDLILAYVENKTELDSYKKLVDKENAEIKSIMLDGKLDSYPVGDYNATCTISTRETINEEMLVSLFTSVPAFEKLCGEYGIVKQKPYIDFDALEKVLYDGKLSDDQILEINKAREVKEVVTLRVTKLKKKEKE